MKKYDAFCKPEEDMSSKNVNDAKKECDRNPSCHMFYVASGEYINSCEKTAQVFTGSLCNPKSSLYQPLSSSKRYML